MTKAVHHTSWKTLPTSPGVYIFKDKLNKVLYIGKAVSLRERVRSYFGKTNDPKVLLIQRNFDHIEHIPTHSEIEALLLEAQLIQDYQPIYNRMYKYGSPFLYIVYRQPTNALPELIIHRHPDRLSHVVKTWGPFLEKSSIRRLHSYIMEAFLLHHCPYTIEHGCLDYHIGRCAGTCRGDFDKPAYLERMAYALAVLDGNHHELIASMQQKLEAFTKERLFEKARDLYKYLVAAQKLAQRLETEYSAKRYKDHVQSVFDQPPEDSPLLHAGLHALQELLQLPAPPQTIDCFDISHFQSNALVGACVRYTNGLPDTRGYRRFKIKTLSQQNDYAALQEIVKRRYKNPDDRPDIIMIDGGKGQRNSVLDFTHPTPCISLAKREERLYTPHHPEGVVLDVHTPLGQLLIALRDYTHRAAITYHRWRRSHTFLDK